MSKRKTTNYKKRKRSKNRKQIYLGQTPTSKKHKEKLQSIQEKILEEKIKRLEQELSEEKHKKNIKFKENMLQQVVDKLKDMAANVVHDKKSEEILYIIQTYVDNRGEKYFESHNKQPRVFPAYIRPKDKIKINYIASGVSGNVFKIEYMGMTTAMKQIRFHNKEEILDIHHEIYILSQLGQIPHFFKYYSNFMSPHSIYLFMECFEGTNLTDTLVQISKLKRIVLFKQLCNSIHLMHKHDIVHNDLNHNNILVNPKTLDYKIFDFGLSICFGQYKHNLCEKIKGRIPYLYDAGFSGGYIQIAPWRSKNCGTTGCNIEDLKLGDFWAICYKFYPDKNKLRYYFENERTSTKFKSVFSQIYEEITKTDSPPELIENLTPLTSSKSSSSAHEPQPEQITKSSTACSSAGKSLSKCRWDPSTSTSTSTSTSSSSKSGSKRKSKRVSRSRKSPKGSFRKNNRVSRRVSRRISKKRPK